MQNNKPLYALDFDGVICDSAMETGITGWKAAHQIWRETPAKLPEDMIDLFRQVRPVMETGYEAILIMRLLFEGVLPQQLLGSFSDRIASLQQREQLTADTLKQQFGETRDRWISNNLDEWIAMNPLFDGVAEMLRNIEPQHCYIITTKQERFVHQIFQANGIALPDNQIFGLDRNLSKTQILADLLTLHPKQTILFVEDRLPTLINIIKDRRLKDVNLFFANWGYNTKQDQQKALKLNSVTTISLATFTAL